MAKSSDLFPELAPRERCRAAAVPSSSTLPSRVHERCRAATVLSSSTLPSRVCEQRYAATRLRRVELRESYPMLPIFVLPEESAFISVFQAGGRHKHCRCRQAPVHSNRNRKGPRGRHNDSERPVPPLRGSCPLRDSVPGLHSPGMIVSASGLKPKTRRL